MIVCAVGEDPFLEGIALPLSNHPSVAATNEHCIDCHGRDADLSHHQPHIIHYPPYLGFPHNELVMTIPFLSMTVLMIIFILLPIPTSLQTGSKVLAMLVAA